MAGPKLFDRVKDTTSTTGTGTLTLANSAPTGFRTFGSVLSDGDTVFYAIAASASAEWEVGIGTYTASGTTLARTTVLASSNAGAAVNLSAGTKDVFLPAPALIQNYLFNPTNTVANLTAYMAGRVGFPSDGVALLRDTGSAMVPWGPIYPLADPNLQTWAWINQGSASVVSTYGGIFMECPADGSNSLHIRKKSAPSTPYTITALINPAWTGANNSCGICFRESSSGKLVVLWIGCRGDSGGQLLIYKMDSATVFNAAYVSAAGQPYELSWLRIADDGTNRKTSISPDGQNWVELHSVGRTDFLTADEVGWFTNANGTLKAGFNLLSWKEA